MSKQEVLDFLTKNEGWFRPVEITNGIKGALEGTICTNCRKLVRDKLVEKKYERVGRGNLRVFFRLKP